jgi:hypothetical protein
LYPGQRFSVAKDGARDGPGTAQLDFAKLDGAVGVSRVIGSHGCGSAQPSYVVDDFNLQLFMRWKTDQFESSIVAGNRLFFMFRSAKPIAHANGRAEHRLALRINGHSADDHPTADCQANAFQGFAGFHVDLSAVIRR